MKIYDCPQGSEEWHLAKLGIPSASEFSKIITPLGKPSKQAEGYMNWLLAELMAKEPLESFKSDWMQRGNEIEPDAVKFYEFTMDIEAVKIGFITNDEGTAGCSPDRLLGDDGLLEIKCPAPNTQVDYLLNKTLDSDYYPQLQGQLYVTGRKWVDIISYHPKLPPVIIRVERDLKYIEELSRLLAGFNNQLAEKKAKLKEMGHLK